MSISVRQDIGPHKLLEIQTDRLRLLVYPAGGRLLELEDRKTGRQHLYWMEGYLPDRAQAGGVGDMYHEARLRGWGWQEQTGSQPAYSGWSHAVRKSAGGLELEMTREPWYCDDLGEGKTRLRRTLRIRNDSPTVEIETVYENPLSAQAHQFYKLALAVIPAMGGKMGGGKLTGGLHENHRLYIDDAHRGVLRVGRREFHVDEVHFDSDRLLAFDETLQEGLLVESDAGRLSVMTRLGSGYFPMFYFMVPHAGSLMAGQCRKVTLRLTPVQASDAAVRQIKRAAVKFPLPKGAAAELAALEKKVLAARKAATADDNHFAAAVTAQLEIAKYWAGRQEENAARLAGEHIRNLAGMFASKAPRQAEKAFTDAQRDLRRQGLEQLGETTLPQRLQDWLKQEWKEYFPNFTVDYYGWLFPGSEIITYAGAFRNKQWMRQVAEMTLKVYVSCMEKFQQPHYETVQIGNLGMVLARWALELEHFGAMSLDEKARFYRTLLDMAYFTDLYQSGAHGGNWAWAERTFLVNTARLMPFHPLAQSWREQMREEIREQAKPINKDGGHREAPGYTGGMGMTLLKAAREVDNVPWEKIDRSFVDGACYRHVSWLARTISPLGTNPRIGNSETVRPPWSLINAAKVFRKGDWVTAARLAGWKPSMSDIEFPLPLPKEKPFVLKTDLLRHDGIAMLRHGQDICMSLLYGKLESHQHKDMMSFELFGRGEYLSCDPGRGPGYTSDEHTKWFSRTHSHNTLCIDDAEFTNLVPGKLLHWKHSEGRTEFAAACEVYRTLTLTRRVVHRGEMFEFDDTLAGLFTSDMHVAHWNFNSFVKPQVSGRGVVMKYPKATVTLTCPAGRINVVPALLNPLEGKVNTHYWQVRFEQDVEPDTRELRFPVKLVIE